MSVENGNESDHVIWTPDMPDRRLIERRSGFDRRSINGRAMSVPDMRGTDRRDALERRKVRLTITGRAMDA